MSVASVAARCACGTGLRRANRDRGTCDKCEARRDHPVSGYLCPEGHDLQESGWSKKNTCIACGLHRSAKGVPYFLVLGLGQVKERSGMSWNEIAFRSAIPPSTLRFYLTGQKASLERIKHLALAFGVGVDDLKRGATT